MSIKIIRKDPRDGLEEYPVETERGYEMSNRRIPENRHHVENSTFLRSLNEAAHLIQQGYCLRMTGPGKRPSLISAVRLQIVSSK